MKVIAPLLLIAVGSMQAPEQAPVALALTIAPAMVERQCRLDDRRYVVDVRVATRYSNIGPGPIAVIPESATLTAAEYSKDIDGFASGKVDVRLLGTVVLRSDPSGPWKRDQIRILRPDEALEDALRLSMVASIKPRASESDLVVAPGRYFLRVSALLYVSADLPFMESSSRYDTRYVTSDISVVTVPEPNDAPPCSV